MDDVKPGDRTVELVAVADLHGHLPELPAADLLVIAGDVFPVEDHRLDRQLRWLSKSFAPWLAEQRFEQVLLVAGNHDFLFEAPRQLWINKLPTNVSYLQDETITVLGLLVHGSPWTPTFGGWAFELREVELIEKWKLIGDELDLLLVHGPPFGACDRTADGHYVGSRTLQRRLSQLPVPPQLLVCGHVHEAYGPGESARRWSPTSPCSTSTTCRPASRCACSCGRATGER